MNDKKENFTMSRFTTHFTKTALLIALSLIFASLVRAQTITEALQKQIWAPTYVAADWEQLLPGADQDTVFSADGRWAEQVSRSEENRPWVVTTLEFVDGQWQPQTQTNATMDSDGRLKALLSYQWQDEHWENESWASYDLGALQMRYWVDGAWEIVYRTPTPIQTIIGANLEP